MSELNGKKINLVLKPVEIGQLKERETHTLSSLKGRAALRVRVQSKMQVMVKIK